jgi:hypothetical protein
MAREVPRSEWAGALERFSREHRAWLAVVDRAGEHPLRVAAPPGALDGLAPGER